MATLTPQVPSLSGLTPSYAAATAGGDQVACDDRTFLHVKNTNGSTRDVTIATPGTVDGLAIADVVVTVPATTGDKMIGPLFSDLFASAADGVSASITYSSTTNVTVANLVI